MSLWRNDEMEVQPRIFQFWVRPFHWNFAQYLPAYLQWRSYVDTTVTSQHYADELNGHFEVQQMISWKMRRQVKRVTAKWQRRLDKLNDWMNPDGPLPPPEPPPSWNMSFHWEREEVWMYTFLEPWEDKFDIDDEDKEVNVSPHSADTYWDQLVSQFVESHNPATITDFVFKGFNDQTIDDKKVTVNLTDPRTAWNRMWAHAMNIILHLAIRLSSLETRALLLSVDTPRICTGSMVDRIPLIIDSGASVCVTPCREDFTVYRDSTVKIKDLSKTNTVAGEGLIRWKVKDKTGKTVFIDLPGYHIPKAEVRLLSPQVLLKTVGGSSQGIITPADFVLCLGNGVELRAQYCPRSNLPLLKICDDDASDIKCFWTKAFHISNEDTFAFAAAEKSVLDSDNANLTAAEKELLLWHQRLSHASISWLQPLMRTKKWLRVNHSTESLHQGPFLPCKEARTASCPTTGIRCAACLASKATTRSAGARHESHDTPSQKSLDKLASRVNGERTKKLKRGDVERGNCISADHYISLVVGCL